MKDDWDRGHWCPICHQKHLQISPACLERQRQREEEAQNPHRLVETLAQAREAVLDQAELVKQRDREAREVEARWYEYWSTP